MKPILNIATCCIESMKCAGVRIGETAMISAAFHGLRQILIGVRQVMGRLGTLMSTWLNGTYDSLSGSDLLEYSTTEETTVWQVTYVNSLSSSIGKLSDILLEYGQADDATVRFGLDNWTYRVVGGKPTAAITGQTADMIGNDAIIAMESILEMPVTVVGYTQFHVHRAAYYMTMSGGGLE